MEIKPGVYIFIAPFCLPLRRPRSDEACTSGQLVIASRESQYKVFHFHHGGLDKLCDVFQQWKYCTETHLKDQVAQRATGGPRRGSRPAAETPSPPLPSHGGEGLGLPRAEASEGCDPSLSAVAGRLIGQQLWI